MTVKKTGLGRNLNVLLSNSLAVKQKIEETATTNQLKQLSTALLKPGKYQPRTYINDDALQELANSIKQHGIVQPIVVRAVDKTHYEIIAGERRWRAAMLAGLNEVPVLINDVADETAIALALIENIQRQDLNAIEEAMAYQRLITEFNLTHQQVAEAVGKSRTTVTNTLRLMNLTDAVKQLVASSQLEMGHSRALLALSGDAQTQAANTVVSRQLSVRETEKLVKKLQQPTTPVKAESFTADNTKIIEQQAQLSQMLGTPVRIEQHGDGKGKIIIQYNNAQKLQHILTLMS